MDYHVSVSGLSELRKALQQAERTDDLKELRDGLRRAADIGADEARHRANAFSFTVADTIRPTVGGNRAYVVGGKGSLPWYGWADFGSRNARSGNPRTVGPWARSGRGPRKGRFIYPALEAKERQIVEAVEDALVEALKRLGI